MEIQINLIAVAAAALARVLIELFWYSKTLFGKQWRKLSGLAKKETVKDHGPKYKSYLAKFGLSLLTAFVLFHVMNLSSAFYYEFSALTIGINTAFWMWLGFILPIQAAGDGNNGRPWQLLVINTGFQYFSLVIMAVIISWIAF